jgi:hypothetical protein
VVERLGELDANLHLLSEPDEDPARLDEFAATGADSAEALAQLFAERFFFGCEADDPLNALAYQRDRSPFGLSLHALFGSDIGHWDVPEIDHVLLEAFELVEDGIVSAADFRHFAFASPLALWTASNPRFFAGTAVEGAVAAELST